MGRPWSETSGGGARRRLGAQLVRRGALRRAEVVNRAEEAVAFIDARARSPFRWGVNDCAVYVADWCDKRATHVDPLDTWDRSNGRVYKIEKTGTKAEPGVFDLSKLTNDQLVELLSNKNVWFARQALRCLLYTSPSPRD